MKIHVFTIFPNLFKSMFSCTVIGNSMQNGLWSMEVINIRDFANDKHKSVDDTPYGGGPGMIFKPDVLESAINSVNGKIKLIHMSPKGKVMTQQMVSELSKISRLGIIASRYEGVDQRLINRYDIEEISIGDYVLTGGELPAACLIDAVVRLIPGVLGNSESSADESFSDGLLEYDQYTKPQEYHGVSVPEILLSGNHKKIDEYRHTESMDKTRIKRKDLWFKFVKKALAKPEQEC